MDIDWHQCDCNSIIIEIQKIVSLIEAVIVMCANMYGHNSLNWGYKDISN